MKLKPIIYILFALSFALLAISVAILPGGWLKQSTLFLGVVLAITAMAIRISLLLKKDQ